MTNAKPKPIFHEHQPRFRAEHRSKLGFMSALKLFLVVALAVIIAAGALVGVYAVAETIVVAVSSELKAEPKPIRLDARLDARGSAVKRSTVAIAAYEAARAECRALSDADRSACLAIAKSERARTIDEVNLPHGCGMYSVEPDSSLRETRTPIPSHSPIREMRPHVNERAPRNFAKTDITLYQTHPQMLL